MCSGAMSWPLRLPWAEWACMLLYTQVMQQSLFQNTQALQQDVLHVRVVERLRSALVAAELPTCAPPAADAAAALAAHLPAAALAPLVAALLPRAAAADGAMSTSPGPSESLALAAEAPRPAWALALGLRLAEAVLTEARGAETGSGSGSVLASAEHASGVDAEPSGPAEEHGVISGVVDVLTGSGLGHAPRAHASSQGSAAAANGQRGAWQGRTSVQEAAEGCMLLALSCTGRGWRQAMYAPLIEFRALLALG